MQSVHSVIKIPIHKPGTTKRAPPIWFVSVSGSYLCYLWLKRIGWIDCWRLPRSVHSVHSVVNIPILNRARRSAPLPVRLFLLSGLYLCNLWLKRIGWIDCWNLSALCIPCTLWSEFLSTNRARRSVPLPFGSFPYPVRICAICAICG